MFKTLFSFFVPRSCARQFFFAGCRAHDRGPPGLRLGDEEKEREGTDFTWGFAALYPHIGDKNDWHSGC